MSPAISESESARTPIASRTGARAHLHLTGALVVTIASVANSAGCVAAQRPPSAPAAEGAQIEVSATGDPSVVGADVWLDNELKGSAPRSLPTAIGRHLVELKKPGFETFAEWVAVGDPHQRLIVVPSLHGKQRVGVLAVPNSWRYAATSSDGEPIEKVQWEGGPEDFSGPAWFVERVEVSAKGASRVDERSYYTTRPDGLYYLGNRSDTESADAVSHTHSTADSAFATPLVMLARPFEVGAKWTAKSTLKVAAWTSVTGRAPHETASHSTTELSFSGEVTGREQVTVPAGVFDCLIVRGATATRTTQDDGAHAGRVATTKTVTTSWYAPRIGLVRSELTSDLEPVGRAYAGAQHRTATTVLEAYRVPHTSSEMEAIGFVVDLPPQPSALPAP